MITPAFALNFTTATLDPRITFTRAGNTATVTNSSGYVETINADLPRFDYSPSTLVCRGLLIEESRSNLMLYSEDFRNTTDAGSTRPWSYVRCGVTANSTASPDGTNNADALVEDSSASSTHYLQQFITKNALNIAYTFTCYVKKGSRDFVQFWIPGTSGGSNGVRATFDLATGAVGTSATIGSGWTLGAATISPAANGFYRCSLSFTSGTETTLFAWVMPCTSTSLSSVFYTGNGSNSLYVWGAQLEAGASPTSYIGPTTTAAVTRNADVATITGTNFSDFWQAVKSGASVLATPSTVSGIRPLVQFDDNTANEIIALRGNTTNPELYIVDGGAPQAQIDAGTIAANTAYSLTGWWDTNDCKARKDSGAVVIDTTATIPTVTQMRIGSDGTNYLNGTLATINYYDSFFGQPIYTRRKNKVFPSLL